MLIFAAIMYDRYYNIFLWLSIVLCFISIIIADFFITHTIKGICSIGQHSISFKNEELIEFIEFIEICEILFVYGGYKGKSEGFINGFFTGSNYKNGVNNYLIIKKDAATKIQIMLSSKNEYQQLLDKLAEIEKFGTKVKKTSFVFFEFSNLLKKIKLWK